MLFVVIFIIILIVLLLIGIFFIIILGISVDRFIKGDKTVGYFFLGTLLFFVVFAGFLLLTKKEIEQTLTDQEAKELLKKEKIILEDSTTVLNYKYENDLYFYRLQFDLKISDNDFKRLSDDKPNKKYILQDYTKEGINIHDTLKINLSGNILHFYKAQYDTNN